MGKSIGVSIVGGTGFGTSELLRLLSGHPEVEVVSVISASKAGDEIKNTHPHLLRAYESKFSSEINFEALSQYEHQVIITSMPSGQSAEVVRRLREEGVKDIKLIDLAGDFRLTDQHQHVRYYPETEYNESLRRDFIYGLPELYRDQLRDARRVANPGCYSTASLLAALPLIDQSMGTKFSITGAILVDAKSGTSGAGRALKQEFHHPRMHADVFAYNVLEHRHEAEIRQTIVHCGGKGLEVIFVPQVIPISRGISITAYLQLEHEVDSARLYARYRDYYSTSPFIRVRKDAPHLADVVGSNYCDIAIFSRGTSVVILAVLDNLVKGMAGQAVQNMNIMCGLPEETALSAPGLGLV